MGALKGQVSTLVVTALAGRAILPTCRGKIAGIFIKGGIEHSLQYSLILPVIAYASVAFYGWISRKIERQGGISAENGCS